jgi:hypothetical protein
VSKSLNNNFDKKVKSMLENSSVEPPAFLWNSIEEKLPISTPWYKKHKYVLFLLFFSLFSTGSLIIYENQFISKERNATALNKRMYKDEISFKNKKKNNFIAGKDTFSTSTSLDLATSDLSNESNNSTQSIAKNQQKTSTVVSFYESTANATKSAPKSTAQQVAKEQTNKTNRLHKFEVKVNKSDVENEIQPDLTTVSDEKLTAKKSNKKLATAIVSKNKSISEKNKTIDAKSKSILSVKSKNKFKQSANTTYLAAKNSIKSDTVNKSLRQDDVTKPISEPIRNVITPNLLVSISPIKMEYSPLNGRSTLRSFVEPAKLEYLAIEDNAIGIDNLSPSMDKMLKNLKQFSGYDINKGIHFGAFILINNVWLSNKKHSMDENTQSIRPMITFGKAYGINIGYDFSDRWGTQIEWQIAEQGQRYKVKQADQYHTKEINLLYTKFPIVAKYKQTFNNNYNAKPIALSFIFGPQLGVLIKQKYSLAGEPITSMASYSKVEFGMLVGFDFDLFMTRNVAMTIGARSGFMAPTQRNKPMSFQLGITSQFNFRFPKKIK